MEENREMFFKQLALLAQSYLPQWNYAPDSGEPASALLQACGELLWDSRERTEQLFDKHEIEFLNCLQPTQRAADSPCCFIGFHSSANADNFLLEKGTRLYTVLQGNMCVFSLRHAIHVCSISVEVLFYTSARKQKIISALPPKANREQLNLPLFHFEGKGIQKNEVHFFHPVLFHSSKGIVLSLRPKVSSENQEFLLALANPALIHWSLGSLEGEVPIDSPHIQEDVLTFQLPPSHADCLIMRAGEEEIVPQHTVFGLTMGASSGELPAEYVLASGNGEDVEKFLPFGEKPSPFMECLIASDEIFCRHGSKITLRFHISFQENLQEIPVPEEELPDFKYVIRRPRPQPKYVCHHVYADEIRAEYYDGEKWTMLPLNLSSIFKQEEKEEREVQLQFYCPKDFSVCTVNGEERHWLRLRLLRAENSGWLPCLYHAPVIRGLRLSSVYELTQPPTRFERFSGTSAHSFLPEELRKGIPFFKRISGEHEAIYMGLNRKPDSPFRLFLELEECNGGVCTFSYSRADGSFAPAKVRDGTDGLAHSGGLSLVSSPDFEATALFGATLWWLRIEDATDAYANGAALPVLRGIFVNGVSAQQEEESSGTAIPKGTVFHFQGNNYPATSKSLTATYGGSSAESRKTAHRRTLSELRSQGRAVTEQDLELLIAKAFREIDKVKCLVNRQSRILKVSVLMRDFEHRSLAFAERRQAIEKLVNEHAGLESLGLRCEICQPEVVPFRITAWLRGVNKDLLELEMEAAQAITRFLHPVTGGFDGSGWAIGILPDRDQLCTCLRLLHPQLVIEELLLTCCPRDDKEQEIDCLLGNPFVLPVSGSHVIRILP